MAAVTIADAAAAGVKYLVWCECGHRAEVDLGTLSLSPATPVPGLENRFRCSSCGVRNGKTHHPVKGLMDPRRPGQDVGYPAL